MSKDVTTVSDEGFAATNEIRDFDLRIDAGGEETPDTLETLLAAYATCYVPALRVGGRQRDVDELGRIEIDVTGELNDDDKLASVSFDVTVEADVDDETAERIVDRANELCKVHDALKSELHADVAVEGGA
ncbi:OsmC family protein [Halovivax sp.]|uniref:OsmC family protein n=1 Tax=Halovivax sp. TaxID=1935978 RepID=UPI0025C6DA0F|nr:OsmC family protein [Halovivax sp.]